MDSKDANIVKKPQIYIILIASELDFGKGIANSYLIDENTTKIMTILWVSAHSPKLIGEYSLDNTGSEMIPINCAVALDKKSFDTEEIKLLLLSPIDNFFKNINYLINLSLS